MKISRRFKTVLYTSLAALYFPGAVTWVLQTWFKIDRGFGPEPIWQEMWALRMHSIAGLWFLMVFGYLVNSHVIPAWHNGLKLKSGVTLFITIAILIGTVPCLFYLTADSSRTAVAYIHTYIGLLSLLPFVLHLLLKASKRSSAQ